MKKYKKNKEIDELRTIQAKAENGAFADDTSQNAKKGADLVQLAADSEEQSEEKTLQKMADTQSKKYAGNSGGDDKPSNNGIPNDMQKGFEQYSGTSLAMIRGPASKSSRSGHTVSEPSIVYPLLFRGTML